MKYKYNKHKYKKWNNLPSTLQTSQANEVYNSIESYNFPPICNNLSLQPPLFLLYYFTSFN